MRLPSTVQPNAVYTEIRNGILWVTLPKIQRSTPRGLDPEAYTVDVSDITGDGAARSQDSLAQVVQGQRRRLRQGINQAKRWLGKQL